MFKNNNIALSEKQQEQFKTFKNYIHKKDYKNLSDNFRYGNIIDFQILVNDDCYTFYTEVHSHNLESQIVNFTFIYLPPMDKNIYGIEDVIDILEEGQKENSFVLELSIPKWEITEIRLRTMVTFANYLDMSIYMSVADYKRYKRISDNLYGVSSIILDLDTYNSFYALDTDEEVLDAMQPTFERIGIYPSMYINSGNGRYLVYNINNINLSCFSMRKLYKETVKKLIFQFKEFGADSKCSDITRIFRVPGNINPKTNNQSYIINNFNEVTTLSDLATAVGICKGEDVNDKTKKNKKRVFHMYHKSIANSKYSKVNQERDIDFQTLLELRNYDIKGFRNIFFHLMSVNCFYIGMEEQEVLSYLKGINDTLALPYEELESVVRYAKNNYEAFEENYEKGIKYKNRTIVELLEITEKEQKEMLQLIDQEEFERRREESVKKQLNKRHKYTDLKKNNLKEKMLSLRNDELLDNKQISKICKIDRRTVNKLIGNTPKFVTVGQVDTNKAVYYYSLKHLSNKQIAELLNLSVRTVKRIKKQSEI